MASSSSSSLSVARALSFRFFPGRAAFRAMKHTITGRTEKTLMKLVVDADTDKVLGVHMVGAVCTRP